MTFVPVLRSEELGKRSELAIALMLLSASWMVYLARPTAVADSESRWLTVGFEVVYDHEPPAGDLDCGLKALSVACRLCANEARVLQDAAVADAYLAITGWDQQTSRP